MAVGNINLSRVNISLAEFQKMSDGKYNAIGDIFRTCKDRVCDIYKKGPLDDVGPDDFFAHGVPMQILALDSVPGLMDKIQTFFAREDVQSLDFDAVGGSAANAQSLRYALDRAAELPVPPGDVGKNVVENNP